MAKQALANRLLIDKAVTEAQKPVKKTRSRRSSPSTVTPRKKKTVAPKAPASSKKPVKSAPIKKSTKNPLMTAATTSDETVASPLPIAHPTKDNLPSQIAIADDANAHNNPIPTNIDAHEDNAESISSDIPAASNAHSATITPSQETQPEATGHEEGGNEQAL